MIINNIVHGAEAVFVPGHLSFGQYLIDKLRSHCTDGVAVALINDDTGDEATYHQILQDTVDIATGLKKLGLRRGDVVAICSESRVEYITTAIAVICCGATVTAVNLLYSKEEMSHVLNISKPTFIIGSSSALKQNIGTFRKLSYVKKIIQFDEEPLEQVVPLSRVVAKDVNVDAYEPEEVEGKTDVVYILYSSGTTGLPKGVMLTHLNALYNAEQIGASPQKEKYSPAQTVVPWYHGYGLMGTISYVAMKEQLIYFNKIILKNYLAAIQKYKVQVLLTVPPTIVLLSKAQIVSQYDLSSVRVVWCAAAPLSSDTIKGALNRLPNCLGIFQAYGMTETSLAATKDQDFKAKRVGSGGTPLPGVQVKVVDIETRKKLGPREKGEVCIKGPIVMKGYAGDEAATRAAFDEEGFVKTGDIGYYDEDGYFFIVDRLKEVIKYKGFQVPPAEVESVVLQHPGVAECGVAGALDEAAGELPTAFVVAKRGARLSASQLIAFTASRLSPAKRLHGGVIFVDEIPKTASGKILRRVLRQKLQEMKKSKL